MFEMLSYDFMQRSLLAAVLVGAMCSVIGVFVVLRGLAFVGAGTAHAAFAGVALAYLVGLPPLPLAIGFGLATVWLTGVMEEKGRMKLDVSIGILYTATMALAILFIGLMKGYNAEVYGYLFGSVLSVTPEELGIILALSLLVLAAILAFSKELYFIAFDQEMAEASGVPARRIFYLLLTLVALTVVVSLKTVGAILVFAMVLIPASTAYQLTHSLSHMTAYSVGIGIFCATGGVMLSYFWDLPASPAIVLLAT
ncbi:MAG: metal ABC transporter permease, partial [Nitrospiraceae bacterium]